MSELEARVEVLSDHVTRLEGIIDVLLQEIELTTLPNTSSRTAQESAAEIRKALPKIDDSTFAPRRVIPSSRLLACSGTWGKARVRDNASISCPRIERPGDWRASRSGAFACGRGFARSATPTATGGLIEFGVKTWTTYA